MQKIATTVVPDLCVRGVHVSQHLVSVPVVLKAPIGKKLSTDVQTFETPHNTLKWITQKFMPHFPLSFTASSNLPSAMAVVTSLV